MLIGSWGGNERFSVDVDVVKVQIDHQSGDYLVRISVPSSLKKTHRQHF